MAGLQVAEPGWYSVSVVALFQNLTEDDVNVEAYLLLTEDTGRYLSPINMGWQSSGTVAPGWRHTCSFTADIYLDPAWTLTTIVWSAAETETHASFSMHGTGNCCPGPDYPWQRDS